MKLQNAANTFEEPQLVRSFDRDYGTVLRKEMFELCRVKFLLSEDVALVDPSPTIVIPTARNYNASIFLTLYKKPYTSKPLTPKPLIRPKTLDPKPLEFLRMTAVEPEIRTRPPGSFCTSHMSSLTASY